MKIVKVNKSQLVGLRGNIGTTDSRTYQSKMMVELNEDDMGRIFKYRSLSSKENSLKHLGFNVLESVESLDVEDKLTDYLNQKLHNQISYRFDGTLEDRNKLYDEAEKEYGWNMDEARKEPMERRFDDTELVVLRIKRKDRHNDSINMKNHLGINDKEVK